MEYLLRDIRHGARRLRRDKVFTLTAVATLGACLAANTFVFSIVYSVLLSPLPVPESDRIVTMYNSYPNVGGPRAASCVVDYYDRLEALDDVFEEQAVYDSLGITVGEPLPPQRLDAMEVTPSFFRLLRVDAMLGRTFTEEEGEPGNDAKVILSHALWQQAFGGRSDVVGEQFRLDGVPFTIVGVMAPDFVFVDPDTRLWIPAAFTADERADNQRHSNINWEWIGRLREAATLEQVRSRLDALIETNYERFPEMAEPLKNAGYTVKALPLKEELVGEVRPTLFLLWGGVILVLAIGLVNLANLVLTRTSGATRELGTRFALGAGVGQIARQLLSESLLVGGFAGGIGFGAGWLSLRTIGTLGLDQLPRGSEISLNAATAVIVLAIGLLAGLLLGAIPLVQAMRLNLSGVFRGQTRQSTAGLGAHRLRSGLVVAQVGLALTLLLGAGLLLASFREILKVDPGFKQPETLMTARVRPPASRFPTPESVVSFSRQLLEALRAIPAVESAALTTNLPFGGSYNDSVILAIGYEMKPGESVLSPSRASVTPDFFEAMGIPILEGRSFDSRDTSGNQPTIILDERLARHFFPGESAIGREMYFPDSPEDVVNPPENIPRLRVVGVVGSVKDRALVEAHEMPGAYYLPFEQLAGRSMAVVLKTSSDPTILIGPLRQAVSGLDAELPVYDSLVLKGRLDRSLVTRRAPMLLTLVFGGLALFLSAVGLYGVLAYLVQYRTNEIGIRMALGSDSAGIFGLVFRHGVVLLVAGLGLGVLGIVGLNRLIAGLLYDVKPLEPLVILPVVGLLAAVTLLACLIPARRATRVDPVKALNG